MNDVIISITTIPVRKELLKRTLPYLLKQNYFAKLIINLDNNLTEEDYKFYETEIASQDKRIEIYKECESKWRSCNKLLPTIKRYPDDIIITLDDDLGYGSDIVKCLLEGYIKFPNCIISHEVNPLKITDDNYIQYLNDFAIKIGQLDYSKYMSNACLFPPHTFDGTDIFNYDKMMALTNGTHDELWFWVNSTLKGIKVHCLNYSYSLHLDSEIQHQESDYQLTNENCLPERIKEYNKKLNELYGNELKYVFNNSDIVLIIFLMISNFNTKLPLPMALITFVFAI